MKYYSSTLQKGSKGNEVKEWQNFLNSQGYNLGVDGDFGNNTYNATVDWQKKNGLSVDGIVGKNTWSKAGYSPYSNTPVSEPDVGSAPAKPTFNTTATQKPVTDTTTWDETAKGQAALGGYNPAKEDVDEYEEYTFTKYQSQWQEQLDQLMNSIINREKFSYDLNGDALYQQYKDKYIKQGKLAMGDAMGQASAMTGGYGNSYAQSVGQQAYNAQLENLNDIVPELYQMALDKYNMEGQDLMNRYGMVMDRENLDYGRHMDEENIKRQLKADEYNRLMDALGIARDDYYSGADMHYSEQANKNNEAWKQYQADEDTRQYENTLLQHGYQNDFNEWDANTKNAWEKAKWDEAARQYANEEAWRQKEWALTNEQFEWQKAQAAASGGDGGNKKDDEPKKILWTATGTYDDKENPIFRDSNGKTQAFGAGVNPYTGKTHRDAKYGTFSNGYQPNNIGGTKLKNSGMSTSVTGKNQTIWEANGKYWLWRDDLGEYIEVDISDLD
jgi:peptidoglycan hydrolase-like protein with peptidoglycan-binding domain